MRRFRNISLFLLSLVGTMLVVVQPVYACDDGDNIYLECFNKERINDALESDLEQDSVNTFSNNLFCADLSNASIGAFGSGANCTSDSLGAHLLREEENQTYGLSHMVMEGMANLYLEPPSGNIPAFYADMLLPGEFIDGGTSLYAWDWNWLPGWDWFDRDSAKCSTNFFITSIANKGTVTIAPKCDTAWNYWDAVGIDVLWSVSFSVAMLFVVFIIILSGFMVMLRSRIGGQTMVTVTMALQNVIFGAFFALGSYAFGIFFVNLSKYLTMVIANLFLQMLWKTFDPDNGMPNITGPEYVAISHIFSTTYISSPMMFVKFSGIMLLGDLGSARTNMLGFFGLAGEHSGIVDAIKDSFVHAFKTVANFPSFISTTVMRAVFAPVALISRLIIFGGLLLVSFRIFWAMIRVYIDMAIQVVLAPLIFVFAAIPGNTNHMKEWFLKMLRLSLMPPAMFALTNIAVFVSLRTAFLYNANGDISAISAVTGGYAPQTATSSVLIDLAGPHLILLLVILYMVPTVPIMMQDLFSGKDTGAMKKAGEEVKAKLQKIPLLGGMVK